MLKINSCTSEEFKKYGYVLDESLDDVVEYLDKYAPIPDEKTIYVRDDDRTHSLPSFTSIKEKIYGQGDMQLGYCNGHNSYLNCLEYHTCPEVNVSNNDIVLLLALQEDVENGVIDSSKVKAFLVKKGQVVVVNPYVFHFAPCDTNKDGFKCAVFLSNGTNRDIQRNPQNQKLWCENKWLYAHKDTKQAQLGAYIGIVGENIKVPW